MRQKTLPHLALGQLKLNKFVIIKSLT